MTIMMTRSGMGGDYPTHSVVPHRTAFTGVYVENIYTFGVSFVP